MALSSGFYRLIVLALALLLVLTACAGPGQVAADQSGSEANSAPQTSLSVSGAFALFPMMAVWTEEYQKLQPNIRFDVQAGGAGKGMTDMLSGAADIAMLSREPRQEELDQGAFPVPVTIDAVVGTVNAKNPHLAELLATGLTPEKGAAIWLTQETKTWGQLLGTDSPDTINVYTRSDASGAGEMWARFLGGQAQEELHGTAVNADPGLAEAVRQDPLGVGYNNIGFAYDQATGEPIAGLQIIPIDLNGDGAITAGENFYAKKDDIVQAIATETYPFPPARVLYLVTRGEPSPEIVAFYRWVLTDGQAFVPKVGYVGLNEARLKEAQALLPQ